MTEETQDGYKIVGVGIVKDEDKYLISQRLMSDHLGGIWEFPGGKKNSDESDEECVARELKEELGIDVSVSNHIETIRYNYPDRKIELRFYACKLEGGTPSALEVEDFRWVKAEELIHFQFPKPDRELVEKLAQGAKEK